MDRGRIVDDGSPAELAAAPGPYRDLLRSSSMDPLPPAAVNFLDLGALQWGRRNRVQGGAERKDCAMSRLVVVSNRVAPIQEGEATAGGLAAGVLDALKQKGGLWFGWSGQVTATRLPNPRRTQGRPDHPLYSRPLPPRLRRVSTAASPTARSGPCCTTRSGSAVSTGRSSPAIGGVNDIFATGAGTAGAARTT